MARANKLYLVFINMHVVAGFTVKHECDTWLERNWPRCPTNLRVKRIADGGRGKAEDITTHFYMEKA